MPADVGTGLTVGFATTLFAAQIVGVNGKSIERAAVETTHLASTVRTFMPGDIIDNGEVELDLNFDPDLIPPIDAAAEVVTVTFPLPVGRSVAAKAVGSGFLTKWEWGAQVEEKMTAKATLKWAGAVVYTDSTV